MTVFDWPEFGAINGGRQLDSQTMYAGVLVLEDYFAIESHCNSVASSGDTRLDRGMNFEMFVD